MRPTSVEGTDGSQCYTGKINSTPIAVNRVAKPQTRPADDDLHFGTVFTDHMFVMDYTEAKGWHDPRIVPFQPFSLSPAAACLHYGQEVFEGLKAYRDDQGRVRFFRANRHAERLNESSRTVCIPPIDPSLVLQSFHALVDIDQAWVPSKRGTALYIRPTIIANEPYLGVRPAGRLLYYIILSPVGSYYAEGMNPVRILTTDTYVRTVKGGLGTAKTAANYAASIHAQEEAHKQGYTQVLWLDGVHRKYLEEVGTMNIMLKIDDEVITPPLGGSILAGVTRDSALTLCREWGMRVSERDISIDEVIAAAANGRLKEMWGTGTAAVISPVGELGYQGRDYTINGGKTGELTQKLYDTIVRIQYGESEDKHGWSSLLSTQG